MSTPTTPADALFADVAERNAQDRGLLSHARVELELVVRGPCEVSLSKIRAMHRGQGDGWAAMRKLMEMADRRGVTLSLIVVPDYHRGAAPLAPGAYERLHGFYRALGFVPADGDITKATEAMVRPPSKTCLLDRPEFRLLAEVLLPADDQRAALVADYITRRWGGDELTAALDLVAEAAPAPGPRR